MSKKTRSFPQALFFHMGSTFIPTGHKPGLLTVDLSQGYGCIVFPFDLGGVKGEGWHGQRSHTACNNNYLISHHKSKKNREDIKATCNASK